MDSSVLELNELKGISYGSLNVRSLNRCLDELKILLHKSELDVLFCQETHLDTTTVDNALDIPHYTLYRWDRTLESGKSKGG